MPVMLRVVVVISPSFLTCDVTRRCIRARRTPARLKRRSSRNGIPAASRNALPTPIILPAITRQRTFMFPDYSACLLNLLFRSSVMVWSILDILSAHSQSNEHRSLFHDARSNIPTAFLFFIFYFYFYFIFIFYFNPTTTLHHPPLLSTSSISWLNFNTFEILLIPCILGSSFFVHLFRSSFCKFLALGTPGNNSYLIPIRLEHHFYFCVIFIIINNNFFFSFSCLSFLPSSTPRRCTEFYTYGAIWGAILNPVRRVSRLLYHKSALRVERYLFVSSLSLFLFLFSPFVICDRRSCLLRFHPVFTCF